MEKLIKQLKKDEGFVGTPYQDTEGHWTVGYGHLMSNSITEQAASKILQDDINIAIHNFAKLPLTVRRNLNEVRRRIIVNMIFNMGLNGLKGFKKMIQAIKDEDFEQAALEMLDSKWAGQTKSRSVRLAETMKHGR